MLLAKFRNFAAPLILLGGLTAQAQYQEQYHHQHHDNYYNGVRDGGRGGYYDNGRDYRDRRSGGIGPGKGALIGGAGGAALGAIFGGGLKGSLIGGAAGAGIGAIAGKAHQNNVRRDDRYYPR